MEKSYDFEKEKDENKSGIGSDTTAYRCGLVAIGSLYSPLI